MKDLVLYCERQYDSEEDFLSTHTERAMWES